MEIKDKTLKSIMGMVCTELDKIATTHTSLDVSTLNQIYSLVDVKKDILEIQEKEEKMERAEAMNGQYSNSAYGNSYLKGYNIEPYEIPNRGYGYNANYYMPPMYYGYSRGNDQEVVSGLRNMASNASPEKKEMIHQFINQLEQMG